jgi:hypothetical protein
MSIICRHIHSSRHKVDKEARTAEAVKWNSARGRIQKGTKIICRLASAALVFGLSGVAQVQSTEGYWVALIYFVIAFPLTRAVTVLEQRILRRLAV